MANQKKKLYRSVLQIEILSDEEIPDSTSLEDVEESITQGHCSGLKSWAIQNTILLGKDAVTQVEKHGTDLEFFEMDSEGYKIDEDEDY